MAQKVEVLLIDDLDGGEASETVSFALDGASFEIDLSAAHAGELRKALEPYTEHARPVRSAKTAATRGGRRGRAKQGGDTANVDSSAVRLWAKDNWSKPLKDRGRVPADVIAAYELANP